MRQRLLLVTLLGTSACGFSETRFEVKAIPLLCEQAANCVATFQTAACIDDVRAIDRSMCDYDPSAARDCFKELEDAPCVSNGDVGTTSIELPESCAIVYPDCEPLFVEPYPVEQG